MTYARDPYDTDQPPCVCGREAGPVLTTEEFCPAHGDPAKPAPESGGDQFTAKFGDGGTETGDGRAFMGNEPACGAPKGWLWGYLPCGCRNDGYGRHIR